MLRAGWSFAAGKNGVFHADAEAVLPIVSTNKNLHPGRPKSYRSGGLLIVFHNENLLDKQMFLGSSHCIRQNYSSLMDLGWTEKPGGKESTCPDTRSRCEPEPEALTLIDRIRLNRKHKEENSVILARDDRNGKSTEFDHVKCTGTMNSRYSGHDEYNKMTNSIHAIDDRHH
jgi:hypothetical protein